MDYNDFIGKYVIIRANTAGVFAGTLEKVDGRNVILKDARRIWYWEGAASLSQLAEEGTNKPDECKFPVSVSKIIIMDVIEIILCSEKAKESILSVKIWQE